MWDMACMEYEETYHGQRIIITTLQHKAGGWKSKADLLDSGNRTTLWSGSDNVYLTEEEARLAALSAAAGAIDRARISKGKP
jgi:hypothetical protein